MMKQPWSILLVSFLTIWLPGNSSAQNKFEIDLKGGYSRFITENLGKNSGWGSNLNFGYQVKKNNFGLALAYYQQHIQAHQNTLYAHYYSFGIYYARNIVAKPKFTLRFGGLVGLGGASTYEYKAYPDEWYSRTFEGKFTPKIFLNGYYILTEKLALSYAVNTHLMPLWDNNYNSATMIFSALAGITFLLPQGN